MNPSMFKLLLQILADRALLFLTLILNFCLFGYAVLYPDNLRFATAGLFSITVFIPVLKLRGGQNAQAVRESISGEG
jgi:hypothetical protein